jgi:hypothetical protein
MLANCTNASCSAPFRQLANGRLIRLEANPPARSSNARATEYFWLCAHCSVGMTPSLAQEGRVIATRLPGALRIYPQVALNSVDRENRRFLRSVTFFGCTIGKPHEEYARERHVTNSGTKRRCSCSSVELSCARLRLTGPRLQASRQRSAWSSGGLGIHVLSLRTGVYGRPK